MNKQPKYDAKESSLIDAYIREYAKTNPQYQYIVDRLDQKEREEQRWRQLRKFMQTTESDQSLSARYVELQRSPTQASKPRHQRLPLNAPVGLAHQSIHWSIKGGGWNWSFWKPVCLRSDATSADWKTFSDGRGKTNGLDELDLEWRILRTKKSNHVTIAESMKLNKRSCIPK